MLAVSEALLVDRARSDDHIAILRGHQPAAEAMVRAVLAGQPGPDTAAPASPEPLDDGEGEMEAASITDLAAWVEQANQLMGGRR